jgi:hypothetical protein
MVANLDCRKMLLVWAADLGSDTHRVLDNIVRYCENHPSPPAS